MGRQILIADRSSDLLAHIQLEMLTSEQKNEKMKALAKNLESRQVR